MTACHCPACADNPADSYAEPWRAETELRHVASLPSRDDRKRYVFGVRKERGATAAAEIVEGLKAMAAV